MVLVVVHVGPNDEPSVEKELIENSTASQKPESDVGA